MFFYVYGFTVKSGLTARRRCPIENPSPRHEHEQLARHVIRYRCDQLEFEARRGALTRRVYRGARSVDPDYDCGCDNLHHFFFERELTSCLVTMTYFKLSPLNRFKFYKIKVLFSLFPPVPPMLGVPD